MDNIYANFLNYLSKQGDSDKSDFIKQIQSKIYSQMSKYTNELVQSELENKLEKKKERKKSFISIKKSNI
jgi:hypothetical protein